MDDCDLGCTDDFCATIYRYWSWLIPSNDSLAVNISVICDEWLPSLLDYDNKDGSSTNAILQEQVLDTPGGCEAFVCMIDWNEDGYINFKEFTTYIARFSTSDLPMDKAIGLNCSSCVGDMNTYDINMNEEGETVECNWLRFLEFLDDYEHD